MAGKINKNKKKLIDQFPVVDDMKLRMSVMSLADQWDEFSRNMILKTYNDPELMLVYKNWRDSEAFQHGWKDKSHREIIRFPNGYVFNFCKAVFEPMYGADWVGNKSVWRHELIRPWMLIDVNKG